MSLALQPALPTGLSARLRDWAAAGLAAERGRLALWLPVAFGAGTIFYFSLSFEPDPGWLWLTPALLIPVLALARRTPQAAWFVGLAAAAALGFTVAATHTGRQPPPLDPPRGAVLLRGIVQSVELLPEGRRVTLAGARLAEDGPAVARTIRVRLRGNDPARPAPGDVLSVRALVRPPSPPAYPGAWDFQRAAYLAGQGGAGFAIGAAEVAPGDGAAPPLAATRSTIEARVTSAVPGAPGAIAAALLTGGQSAIPAAELNAMRDSGLAHLLSVSGLHIAIVMGIAFAVLRFAIAAVRPLALRVPGKAIAAAGALAAGGFYMLLTGSQVPMLRSFAMAALVTLAVIVGRRALSLRTLGLAAAAVMLVHPVAVLGPSFQMSFAAVLALIAGWEAAHGPMLRLRGEGQWWRRGLLWGIGLVGTSLLAGAATAPFGLHHFGRVQWYGIAANALAVPLTSVLVMPAGMLAAALMPFGLDDWALRAMGWGVELILAIAREVASWPGAAMPMRPLPAWGLSVFAFGLCWLCLWRARWRLLGVPLMALGLVSPAMHAPPDVMVSPDARFIVFNTEAGLFIQRLSGASALTRETMLRAYGETTAQPLPARGDLAGVACTPGACTLRGRAVLLRGDPPQGVCGRAPLVVSAEPVRGFCRGSTVVDRFAVWRDGAHAAWFTADGVRVISDRQWRGARPWVPPRPTPRARAPEEPPAAVE